jgi:dimethylsulfide dehydrogenase subunit alpha/complex iron-sulfur molybdoenzyme family reductase subunit alpha
MPTRREFLKVSGAVCVSLALANDLTQVAEIIDDPLQSYPHRRWEDLYCKEFAVTQGDVFGYAFHCSNCQGNCAWKVFVKDGVIVREEQLAQYPQINPKIPDANPRGCNKGAVYSQAMYEKDRLLYPMKRAGKRGEGKWQKISWEEALSGIAEKMVAVLEKDGPGAIMIHAGTGILSQGRRAGPLRLGSLLGSIRLYPASTVGDMFSGASLVYGITNIGHTLDAWFDADCIFLWGINPSVTRIPDAHYLWEGKWNGARVITIAPDYNQTSVHADIWVPIKPGTDSFLAMSMVQVILQEKLYREAFIKEQTDLPFLVRTDNRRLLRQNDLKEGGKEDVFYLWDQKTNRAVEAPGSMGSTRDTLRLGDVDPALEGIFTVRDANGKTARVTTVFAIIKQEAEKFPPEETFAKTNVHPSTVRTVAREFAAAKKAIINIGFSIHKYFWGTLTCWGAALLCALTGHAGTAGGLDTEHNWSLGGIGPLSSPKPPRFGSGFFSEWMMGKMAETAKIHYRDEELQARAGFALDELLRYAEESRQKKWLPYFGEPKVVLLFADNRYVRNKSQAHYRQATLDPTELYVNINYRMDSTAQWADVVLPGQGHYEGWDIRGELGYHRFVNLNVPPLGLKPVGEAKSEWEICRLLAEKVEAIAKAKGFAKIPDEDFTVTQEGKEVPVTRDLDTLHSDFTMDGKLMTDKDVVKWLLENVPAMQPWTLETAEKTGFVILNDKAGFTSPLYATRPYHSFEQQVFLKRPYLTLSGRQQFYIDHDWFLKLGTMVPTAREPLRPAKFPFAYYSPHTRHGIHSTWRSNKYMTRLQRGIPHVYLNPKAARERDIKDGERVRVFNDVGEFYAMAKLHPSTPPWAVHIEHAWENHQFTRGSGYNAPVAGIISPLELAGDYGHLKFSPNWDGNQIAHESSVEVEKA